MMTVRVRRTSFGGFFLQSICGRTWPFFSSLGLLQGFEKNGHVYNQYINVRSNNHFDSKFLGLLRTFGLKKLC